jgi:hypothetical protein
MPLTSFLKRISYSRRQLISDKLPFHEFPEIWNHELWLNILEFREKAGLSKTLMSCRRLISYGLGQRYHHFDEISRGFRNIIIILMQSGYCSENSTKFQTT